MPKSSRTRTAGRVSSASRLSQVRSARPPARWARTRLVLRNRASAPARIGEVGQGLGDVALADADRAVEDDRLAGGQPAQRGEVADLGGGQLRRGGEVEPFEGGLGLEPGPADPPGQGHGLAAADLVLAQDLEEVQVAEFAGAGLGEAGVEGGEHPRQLQVAQRRGERAAVGDGDGGHDGAPFAVTGVTASLGIVPGRGMTFANDAGPRRNADAPPSPAAGGSWSRSAPAARMPRTVR